MNYENAMEYINSFSKTGSKVTDLSRIATLLKKLDNPQNNLKFVHIAGTNGKGSTLEFSSQMLINAGYVVGQFTSPYMLCYEDRIRINNENINKNDLVDFVSIISNLVELKDGYSQFEITMSIAFLYYVKYFHSLQRTKASWPSCILQVLCVNATKSSHRPTRPSLEIRQ